MKIFNFNRFSTSGFSLIELCVVLIIIGLLTSIFASYSKYSLINKRRVVTNEHIAKVHESLAVYLKWYKHLPCPASLSSVPEDEEYGQELDCERIEKYPDNTQKHYVLGKVKREGAFKERDVVIGRVPFKELGIPQKQSQDAWNGELFYAVSLNLTNSDDYSQIGGVIDIIDEFGNTLIAQESAAQYVIWSGGDDQKNLINTDCKQNNDLDAENCDHDGIFRLTDYAAGESHFDDLLSYRVSIAKPDTVDDVCDLVEHLSGTVSNIGDIIKQDKLREESFYIQPGELVMMCNKNILRKLHEDKCALFLCRWDYTISHVEVIE